MCTENILLEKMLNKLKISILKKFDIFDISEIFGIFKIFDIVEILTF